MQFKVPKFLEREAKIIGPFSYHQVLYLALAGVILVFLYFFVPIWLFLIVLLLMTGLILALTFVKIDGVPLLEVIKNSFSFFASGKIYIWQKKGGVTPKISRKEKRKEEPSKTLKVSSESKLSKLSSKIETGRF